MPEINEGKLSAALTTGIIGTAGTVVNGIVEAIMANKKQQSGETAYATQVDLAYSQALAEKDAQLAKVEAERYADSVGISAYKDAVTMSKEADAKINSVQKDLIDRVITLGQEQAATAADLRCFKTATDREFTAVYDRINCVNDKTLLVVQNELDKKISGVLKIPGRDICCENCNPCNND